MTLRPAGVTALSLAGLLFAWPPLFVNRSSEELMWPSVTRVVGNERWMCWQDGSQWAGVKWRVDDLPVGTWGPEDDTVCTPASTGCH